MAVGFNSIAGRTSHQQPTGLPRKTLQALLNKPPPSPRLPPTPPPPKETPAEEAQRITKEAKSGQRGSSKRSRTSRDTTGSQGVSLETSSGTHYQRKSGEKGGKKRKRTHCQTKIDARGREETSATRRRRTRGQRGCGKRSRTSCARKSRNRGVCETRSRTNHKITSGQKRSIVHSWTGYSRLRQRVGSFRIGVIASKGIKVGIGGVFCREC